jgi:hypothetical protein
MEKQVYMDQIFHAKCVQPYIKAEAERKKQELAAKLSGETLPPKETQAPPTSTPTVQPKVSPQVVKEQPATTQPVLSPVSSQAKPQLVEKFCPYCGVERTDAVDNFCGDCGGNLKA